MPHRKRSPGKCGLVRCSGVVWCDVVWCDVVWCRSSVGVFGMQIGVPVGVFGLDEPLTQWHPKKGGGKVGMGGRPCQVLSPEVQVSFVARGPAESNNHHTLSLRAPH